VAVVGAEMAQNMPVVQFGDEGGRMAKAIEQTRSGVTVGHARLGLHGDETGTAAGGPHLKSIRWYRQCSPGRSAVTI